MEKAVIHSAIKRTIKAGNVLKGYEHIEWWCEKYPYRDVLLVKKWFKLWAKRYIKKRLKTAPLFKIYPHCEDMFFNLIKV